MKRKAGRSTEKEARCERRRGRGAKSEGREKGEEEKDELAE